MPLKLGSFSNYPNHHTCLTFVCLLFSFRYHPKRKKIDSTTFKMIFKARGWKEKLSSTLEKPQNPPNTVLMGMVTGGHPGYIATAQCLVQALVTFLDEREKLPDTGGVFTTAPAFAKTSLIQRLNENGIEFQMIK